jgi:hypothetical protein
MKIALTALCLPAFMGCFLLEDGSIKETCDELGTCDGVSDGGVVYVEEDEGAGRWRVVLRDGSGDEIDSWSGQGSDIGGVAYDENSKAAYLSVGSTIRVLQPNSTPKITNIPLGFDAIPMDGGAVFAEVGGWFSVDGENNGGSGPINQPGTVVSVLRGANPCTGDTGEDKPATPVGFLIHGPGGKPSIVELTFSGSGFSTVPAYIDFDISKNRSADAFLMNGAYATCSETGATYMVADLVKDDRDPDRYPSINLGNISSCEYEAETDEVILFSQSGGVGWMNASGKVVRTIASTEGYRIASGSVW